MKHQLGSIQNSVIPSVVVGERPLARPKDAAAVKQGVYQFCASAKENVQRTIPLVVKWTMRMRMMMNRLILQETENRDKTLNVLYRIS